MKKLFTQILASLFVTSAFALDVSQDKTEQFVYGTVNFTAPNVTLTVTGKYEQVWYSPRINFGNDYVYTAGDKVTLNLAEGASLILNSVNADGSNPGKGLFGDETVSESNADIYITGKGTISTILTSIVTSNSISKLFLDASTNFSGATYTIGTAARPTNLTLSNSLIANKLELYAGSIFTMTSDSDSTASITLSGTSYVYGDFIQKAGTYTTSATTSVYGTLDLSVSKGFKTRYLTLCDGSTVIIRAENAIMESNTAYRVFSIEKNVNTTLKLYADQQFTSLWFVDTNKTSVLNAYTNGNALTFSNINNTGTLNIFIEDGSEWVNNKIHFTNATVEKVVDILGTITVGDTQVDKSFWDIVSDGNKGVYINLTAVPEPAEWAMIFGAIAFGFAFMRRQKRK